MVTLNEAPWAGPLRAQVSKIQSQHQIPGLALAVARNGETVFAEGFGHRDVERQLPVTPETVFGCASVTKSFTALAIMQLEDAGRLSVDDPVAKWLPEFKVPNPGWGQQITIHHFLTHTSGLPGMKALYHARAGSIRRDPNASRLGVAYDPFQAEVIATCDELMALIARGEFELLGPPGAWFNYSNEGFALLQAIIERASGLPFLQYMQERVLGPLGMERSCFLTADLERFPEVTELYGSAMEEGQKAVFHAPVWWEVGRIYTNGSLKSNVGDLLRYLEVYRCGGTAAGRRILSAAAVRKMTHPHVQLPTGRQYGYGLDVHPGYHGVTLVGHSGGIKGVSAHVSVAMEAGITVAALANLQNVPTDEATLAATNALLGLPLSERKLTYPEAAVAPEALARYAGLYRSVEGGAARIHLREGRLWLEQAGVTVPTRPFAEDGVVTLDGSTPVRFLARKGGELFGLFLGSRILHRVAEG
jgi:CubicO group peptidase (beta-lactamase class C family)